MLAKLRSAAAVLSFLFVMSLSAIAQPTAAAAREATSRTSGTNVTADRTAIWLKSAAVRFAVVVLRSFAYITFESSDVSSANGGVVVRGITVLAAGFDGTERGCRIGIGEAQVSLDPLSIVGMGNFTVRGSNAEVALSCLPPQGRIVAASAGLDTLRFDTISIGSSYDLPSGGLDYSVRLSADGVADFSAEGRLDYFGLRSNFASEGLAGGSSADSPSIRFGSADVSVVDRGRIGQLALLFGGPEAVAKMAEDAVSERLRQPEFASQVGKEVVRFLSEGSRLTVSLRPGPDVWLDDFFGSTPAAILAALRPSIGSVPLPRTVDEQALAALNGSAQPAADRVKAARALFEGAGVPRNPAKALEILDPLVPSDLKGQDGEVLELIARIMLETEGSGPTVYRFALGAGLTGRPVVALLDRLEAELDAGTIVEIQTEFAKQTASEASPTPALARLVEDADAYALLEAGRSFMDGKGRPRHFGRALTYISVAKAAGEIGAAELLTELERRMDDPAFRPMLRAARDEATDLWAGGGIGRKVAARLAEARKKASELAVSQTVLDSPIPAPSGDLMDDVVVVPTSPVDPDRVEEVVTPLAVTPKELDEFVKVVIAETTDTWEDVFRAEGAVYPPPGLTVFDGKVEGVCGLASAAAGPFYCPGNSRIYLDEALFRLLSRDLGTKGDFANAYVIAHEVGHHVQNVIGVLPKFNGMREQLSDDEATKMAVRVELQADCFAGIWAHYAQRKGLLEAESVDEAMRAASEIGRLAAARRQQGSIIPESFDHATADDRHKWFMSGYGSGRLVSCDTKVFG